MSHTPTPWTTLDGRRPMSPTGIKDRWVVPIACSDGRTHGNVILHVYMGGPAATSFGREDVEANAEFIVRACNHHDEAIRMIEKLRDEFSYKFGLETAHAVRDLLRRMRGEA